MTTSQPDNVHLAWFQTFATLFDLYTNFLCVVLTYNTFNEIYGKLCCKLDRMCYKCWTKLVRNAENKDVDMVSKELEAANTNQTQTGEAVDGVSV